MSEPTTRHRILATARALFATKGYGATSISDILAETGANSGSLYHAFPGKQDLLVAVLDSYRQGIGPMLLDPAWAGVSDPIERIFALLDRYRIALEMSDCFYGCPIGSLALELHEPDPVVREGLAANFDGWVDAVAGNIRAAALPGVDAQALAEFVLIVMEGGVMLARTHRDTAYFDRAVAQLRTHFDLLKGGGK